MLATVCARGTGRAGGLRPAYSLGLGLVAVALGLLLVSLCGYPIAGPAKRSAALLLLAVAGGYAACAAEPRAAAWIARIRGARIAFAMAVGLLLAAFLTGQNVHARWWMIDDHEFAAYTGEDGRLALSEVPATLVEKTEVGMIGASPRCRPVYFILRLLECACWGMRPGLWYAARAAMLGLSIGLLLLVVRRWVGWVGGIAFALFVLLPKYWVDVWTRLGPSEPYAVVGLALYALGFFGVRERGGSPLSARWRSTTADWLLMLAGAVIAIGAKENLIILAAPVGAVLVRCALSSPRDRAGIAFSLAMLGWTAFIGGMMVRGVFHAGHFYKQSVPAIERVALSLAFLRDWRLAVPALALAGGLACIAAVCAARRRRGLGRLRLPAARLAVLLAGCAAVYVSQVLFYGPLFFLSADPQGMRYRFPGMLAAPVALLGVALFAGHLLRAVGVGPIVRRYLGRGLAVGLLAAAAAAGFGPLRYYSRNNVWRTREYSGAVDRIVEACRREPGRPVLFESHSVYDLEPVHATARFLRGSGVHNVLYLRLIRDGEQARDEMWRQAQGELEDVSRTGGAYFQPLAGLGGPDAFVVEFSPPPSGGRGALARIVYRYDME